MASLPVPTAAKTRYTELRRQFEPMWPPTHRYSGRNHDRASVGDPGHCDYCAVLGHVEAHPDFGCGDVECSRAHGEDGAR